MSITKKIINGQPYYYSTLSYFGIDKSKNFNKYIGQKKPSKSQTAKLENSFKDEIIERLYGRKYAKELISKDDLIKAALFRDRFYEKYNSMTLVKRRKYDVDSTIIFTLTTLTTENVDVSLNDVVNAYEKQTGLSQREKISKNMLDAVEFIRKKNKIDAKYLLKLHGIAMSEFETKTPGKFRDRQVYIHKRDSKNSRGIEIAYRPPESEKISELIEEFADWYNKTDLNPMEKAFVAHARLYRIHPFLDGNKRICRLILNKTLLDSGFPLLNISADKEEYFTNLMKSAEKNKPKYFMEFSLKQYFDHTKAFIKGSDPDSGRR